MTLKTTFPLLLLVFIFNCTDKPKKVTNKNDYNQYLTTKIDSTALFATAQFWNNKINPELDQFSVLSARAGGYTKVFDATGNIDYLIKAENDLLESNKISNYKNSAVLKTLATNYISQHRFQEALKLLKIAETNGDKLNTTKKMLFDVHLELGNYIYAEAYLKEIKNNSDFDYLIRLAKWEDHNGNLEKAIENMEKAMTIAESSNQKYLKQWSYTNIADFYGHAGEIEKSYNYFLKALELDPNDAYAKKGIAWIVYSHENNSEEALNILNHVTTYYNAPDYDLLKAEIAEFQNNETLKSDAIKNYQMALNNKHYGEMYNAYDVALYADEFSQPDMALEIAKTEVENRPTPQSYDMLAWSYFKQGNVKKANEIIEEYVDGKTFEPAVLYHVAEIYKAAGKTDKVTPIKKELIASLYELGPLMKSKIKQL
ncbi:tetratricopeptide repeat protein [Winogradskyella bathintestinalis]|uniref:Tetratricopeptide repeat protein n=1 Tax=Winogradskyella bathintestinalis TaxID=3035208 RepID=A0ABT7ZVL3_9FLAO|nr:tetratricopeptide repeat protein [Winogradskyella bathintestinalis]MDN3493012.1 tetratricopeptide repeat protein [Winogradskyella bathintestinalis]